MKDEYQDYFWIQGYEDRYALRYNFAEHKLCPYVYSFISPGFKGAPRAITPESGLYYLWKGGLKHSFSYHQLSKQVRESIQFQSKMDIKEKSTNGGKWIIGSILSDGYSLSANPKTHNTAESAQIEASRLASITPGKKFVVFKAVTEVVSGGVTVTQL